MVSSRARPAAPQCAALLSTTPATRQPRIASGAGMASCEGCEPAASLSAPALAALPTSLHLPSDDTLLGWCPLVAQRPETDLCKMTRPFSVSHPDPVETSRTDILVILGSPSIAPIVPLYKKAPRLVPSVCINTRPRGTEPSIAERSHLSVTCMRTVHKSSATALACASTRVA